MRTRRFSLGIVTCACSLLFTACGSTPKNTSSEPDSNLVVETWSDPVAGNEARQAISAGDKLLLENRYQDAIEKYLDGIDEARAQRSRPDLVEALAAAARALALVRQWRAGRELLAEAEQLASSSDPRAFFRFLLVKSRFQVDEHRLSAASRSYERLYAHCVLHQMHAEAHYVATQMVELQEDPLRRSRWRMLAASQAEIAGDDGAAWHLWRELSYDFEKTREYRKAMSAARHAMIYAANHGGQLEMIRAETRVAETMIAARKFEAASLILAQARSRATVQLQEGENNIRRAHKGLCLALQAEIVRQTASADEAARLFLEAETLLGDQPGKAFERWREIAKTFQELRHVERF